MAVYHPIPKGLKVIARQSVSRVLEIGAVPLGYFNRVVGLVRKFPNFTSFDILVSHSDFNFPLSAF